MNTRFKTLLLLPAVCLASSFSGFSGENQPKKQETPTQKGDGILLLVYKSSNRKRMPSRNFLEIYYENGMLTLESETADGSFSLEIAGDENSVYEVIPSIETGESVSIDLELGQYSVSATDINGMQFAGEMIVD